MFSRLNLSLEPRGLSMRVMTLANKLALNDSTQQEKSWRNGTTAFNSHLGSRQSVALGGRGRAAVTQATAYRDVTKKAHKDRFVPAMSLHNLAPQHIRASPSLCRSVEWRPPNSSSDSLRWRCSSCKYIKPTEASTWKARYPVTYSACFL